MPIYSETVKKEQNKLKNSAVVAGTLIVFGVILIFAGQNIGYLFFLIGCILIGVVKKRKSFLQGEIEKLGSTENIKKEFEDAVDIACFSLTITSQYVILQKPSFKVFRFHDMKKFEVGLDRDIRKALFLTEPDGTRHKIAETRKGDGNQEEFDKAYKIIKKRMK